MDDIHRAHSGQIWEDEGRDETFRQGHWRGDEQLQCSKFEHILSSTYHLDRRNRTELRRKILDSAKNK